MRKLSEIEAQALAYIAPAPHTLDSDCLELVSALREAMRLLESMAARVAHADSCGDADAYNNVPPALQRCGCGLDTELAIFNALRERVKP